MPLKVTNLSRNLVLVRLAGGGTVHLGPGEQSGPLTAADITGNPRVDDLVARHLVSVEDIPEPKKRRAAAATEGASS